MISFRVRIVKENNMGCLYFPYFKCTNNEKFTGNLTPALSRCHRAAPRVRFCSAQWKNGVFRDISQGFFFLRAEKRQQSEEKRGEKSGGKTEAQRDSIRLDRIFIGVFMDGEKLFF